MKIAVVGTGIAGNTAAYHLCREHDITVFEANNYVGGHTNTVQVEAAGREYAVDTGFIVYNDWTYPNFVRLLDELGVESQESRMSFAVRSEATGLEYNGSTLGTIFSQRRNIVSPTFWRMLSDILRFNREAPALLEAPAGEIALGEFLECGAYSRQFIDHYIIPMGAAIWSSDPDTMHRFPARFFVRFFANHGLLSVNDRPTWRVIRGGSKRYVERLTAPFRERIRLDSPVDWIRRMSSGVIVKARGAEAEHFDAVFIATHSDQALALLADPTQQEREILGSLPFQENEAVLHTDTAVLPRSRRAWGAWNYRIPAGRRGRVTVTYNMNLLQSLSAPETFLVTLNDGESIDPARVLRRITYHHPVFTPEGVAAQRRQGEINGAQHTYFCGAYWRNGFHEDGVASALAALNHFEKQDEHAQLSLRRAG